MLTRRCLRSAKIAFSTSARTSPFSGRKLSAVVPSEVSSGVTFATPTTLLIDFEGSDIGFIFDTSMKNIPSSVSTLKFPEKTRLTSTGFTSSTVAFGRIPFNLSAMLVIMNSPPRNFHLPQDSSRTPGGWTLRVPPHSLNPHHNTHHSRCN